MTTSALDPSTATEKTDRKKQLTTELCAAIVLLCIALPLNVGVAIASGVPAEFGIISGAIASLVTGFVTGSSALVSGPDAGIGVLVFDLVQQYGLKNLGVIVVVTGLIQLAIGLTRSAKWFRAVSPAVVNGMLAGMGLIIIFTQFHIMLDDKPKSTGLMNMLLMPEALLKGITPNEGTSHQEAAILALATIAVAVAWTRWAPAKLKIVPNALVGIATVTLAAMFFDMPVKYVTIPASLTQNISLVSIDSVIAAFQNPEMLGAAGMLAFICSAQSLITLSAVDDTALRRGGLYDRELIAQGVGNIACGAIGALPIVGVLLRSMANKQNGAVTRIPNVLHGILMISTIICLPWLLTSIPTSVLAAILVLTGTRMVLGIWKSVKTYEKRELQILALTAVAIISTNLFTGVLIGFVAALLKQLYTLSHLDMRLETQRNNNIAILHMRGAATFLQLPRIESMLAQIPDHTELHVRLDEIRYIDHACLLNLVQWERHHRGRLVIDWSRSGMQFRRYPMRTSQLEADLANQN
ncbi:SulP family inorganic anion transporter [Candidatus Obscuribacterales bacterium]|nr:SulP family inorganic anion transporter [Candidatus Obscuribacterales bacterium]